MSEEAESLESARVCDVGEEQGEPAPSPPERFGAVASQLRSLGYYVGSVLEHFDGAPETFFAEDPADFIVVRGCGALIVSAIADKVLEARAHALLDAHGLREGPVRIDCTGVELYPLAQDRGIAHNRKFTALDGAIVLFHALPIRLNGAWDGRLEDTKYVALPSIAESRCNPLFDRLEQLKREREQELKPKPRPSRLGLIGLGR